MEDRPYAGFYARLLGGFSLSYEGKPVSINANPQSKYMQILLILLEAGEKGMEGKRVMEMVRPDGETPERVQANFRQLLHTLRKAIGRSGFPEGRYIRSRRQKYFFSLDAEVHADTHELDQVIGRIRQGSRKEEEEVRKNCLDYCERYTGEFLPMLSGEEWATAEGAYYQKWYNKCLEQLSALLKRDGEYETLLSLTAAASRIHPYDEWQKVQVECLMALNRHREAVQVYEEAAELFYQDLGVEPLDQVMDSCQKEESRIYYMEQALSRVKTRLREKEEPKGPYPCSYPSFLDTYHVIARLGERGGMECTLLICTLKERESREKETGQPPAAHMQKTQEQGFEQKMEGLRQLLAGGLRIGDAYTRYSKNQYLALLTGTGQEMGSQVAGRLKARWKENSKSPGTCLELTVCRVEGSAQDRAEVDKDGEKENIRGTYSQPGKFHLAGAGHMAGRKGNEKFPEPAGIDQAVGYGP